MVEITDQYRPGVLAQVIGLHMDYYAQAWNFGAPFEAGVAAGMGEFFGRFDSRRDLFLAAYGADGQLIGSLTLDAIDAAGAGVHLRWFIVSAQARGRGLGKALMTRADHFLREHGYDHAYLTTFAGLDAARVLYEQYGFRLVAEQETDPWSGQVGMHYFERR